MRPLVLATLLAVLPAPPALGRGPFERNMLSVPGRVTEVVAEDFTGDGQTDLLVVHVTGLPPLEKRRISLFVGPEDRPPSRRPDHTVLAPGRAAAFDFADIDGQAGLDLLLLDAEGISQLPVGAEGFGAPKRLLQAQNLALNAEESALPRFGFAIELDDDRPRVLFLPTLSGVRIYHSLFSDGSTESDLLRVRYRNRYGTDPGASHGKRNFAFRIDTYVPEVRVGDHDGDGVNDLFSLWEDEVEVFTRDAGGRFRPEPVARYDLDIETRKEKEQRNSWVQPRMDDVTGDGIADLVLSKVSGSALAMSSSVHVFPGREGGGYGPEPAQVIKRVGFTPAVLFVDADGEGAKDLIVASVEFGVAAVLQVLTKKSVDVDFNLFLNQGGRYPAEPQTTIEVPFTINLKGMGDIRSAPPVLGRDFDGDGITDLLHGAGPAALVIHRGIKGEEELFEDHFRVRLKAPTSPWMRVTEGDRPGIVLYFRNWDELKGTLFWFRNRHAW